MSESITPPRLGERRLPPLNSRRGRQHRHHTGRRRFTNWSSRGSNHRCRRRPNHRHYHTNIHRPSLPQNLFWLADSTNLFLPRLENRHTYTSRLLELEADDLITLPWKLNPPVFNGDSLKFRSFCKEATTFADCFGFDECLLGQP